MAWIESHQELWRHPKTKKLSRLLGVSVPTVVGHLHGLWFWALDFAQDGDIGRYDPEEISDAVLWDGNAKAFIDALIGSGFADKTTEGITIHDWNEYAGKLLERRAADRERKRSSAKVSPSSAGIPPEAEKKNVEISRIPSLPYPTVPNPTEPLPLKSPKGGDGEIQKTGIQEASFDRFWEAYPKKIGKAAARKSFQRIKVPVETLIAAIEAQKKSCLWQREHGQFICNPAVWLNQGRWEDEFESAPEVKGVSDYANVV